MQLHEGIKLVRQLRLYPAIPDLSIEPCGDGIELRVERKAINQQGWLRAIFWVHDAGKQQGQALGLGVTFGRTSHSVDLREPWG